MKRFFTLFTLINAVFILNLKAQEFRQQGTKLLGSGAIGNPQRGISVDLSLHGNTAIIGGPADNNNTGAVWIYTRSNGVWSQQGSKLTGSETAANSTFGSSVGISSDANTAIIGGPGLDLGAWMFTKTAGKWTQQGGRLVGSDAIGIGGQGTSVDISGDGMTAIISGPSDDFGNLQGHRGAVWIFERSGNVWTQQGPKLVSDGGSIHSVFGLGVALSSDGNTAVVSGQEDFYDAITYWNYRNVIWVFIRNKGVWTQQGQKLPLPWHLNDGYYNAPISLSSDGNAVIIGNSKDNNRVGEAIVFARKNGVWSQQGSKLTGTGNVGLSDQGWSVAISGDGSTAIIGGLSDNNAAGAAWVFTRSGNDWTQSGEKLVGAGASGQSAQGASVALSSDATTALVGGNYDNNFKGATWVYYNPNLKVTKPSKGEIVRAGIPPDDISVYDIQWSGQGIDSVRIEYSADSGITYHEIIRSAPAAANHYSWNVIDTLATKCLIRISDINDKNKNALSGLFKIKGYVLTRIDKNGNYEKFEAGKHGWRFINNKQAMWPSFWWLQFNYYTGIDPYTNKPYPAFFDTIFPSAFPDWPLWVKTFTESQCYIGTEGVYRGKAQLKWRSCATKTFSGSCYGFAASGFLSFNYKDKFLAKHPGIPNYTNLFDVLMNDEVRYTINGDYCLQYGKQAYDNDLVGKPKDPRTTLEELKDMFLSDEPNIKTISIFNNNGNGGGAHTIAPISLVRDYDSTYYLYVYNSNKPGSENDVIQIDSVQNKWFELLGLGFSWGTSHCYLELPVLTYLETPVLNKSLSFAESKSNGNYVEFYNTGKANVLYTSANGERIGLRYGSVINEIGKGMPIISKTGYPSDPIGYYLPDDTYSVVLNKITDPDKKVYLTVLKENAVYNYERNNADSTQTDRFRIGDGFSVVNPDPIEKHVNLEVIAESEALERIMFVNKIQMSKNDSLFVNEINQQDFAIKNYGTSKTYDLELNERTAQGEKTFNYFTIPLPANTSHTLVPAWNLLNNSILTVFVDYGINGSIDDTLFLTNQVTGIDENKMPSSVQGGYKLMQNYPNPFKTVTKIHYDIPLNLIGLKPEISLIVFDERGKEISKLYEGKITPGGYDVNFDGSNLSNGVYFIKLKSGNIVVTRKMLLMK